MKRRTFFKVAAAASAVLSSGAWAMSRLPSSGANGDFSPMKVDESTGALTLKTGEPLAVPPLYEGVKNEAGEVEYFLNIIESSHEFFEGVETHTWAIGFDDVFPSFLGPALRMKRGEKVRVRYRNNLPETTTMHGHGMHVPAAMDGGPHQKIGAGEEWIAEYEVNQPASTNWFHPHEMGKTAEHVYKGLAGLILVEDDVSESLPLPKTYGVDDIPLVLQDRVFDDAGQILYEPTQRDIMRGYHGDVWLVNGQAAPVLEAGQGILRLRLLNGSNAGIYNLSFDNASVPVYLIGTDGGLIQAPVRIDSIRISAGERAELLLDLGVLDRGAEIRLKVSEELSGKQGEFVTIRVSDVPADVTEVPRKLVDMDLYDVADAVRTRRFVLGMGGMQEQGGMMSGGMGQGAASGMTNGSDSFSRRGFLSRARRMGGGMGNMRGSGMSGMSGMNGMNGMNGMGMQFTINGKSMDMSRIDEVVPVDEVEIWEIENPMMIAHNFHIHAIHFIPLDRNGSPDNLEPWEKDCYKDTIYMPPFSKARFLVKMKDYTDDKMPYMYHCHILEHEDAGMMGQFVVV